MEGLVEHVKEDFHVWMADFGVVAHGFSTKEGEEMVFSCCRFLSCVVRTNSGEK